MKRDTVTYLELQAEKLGRNVQNFEDMHEAEFHREAVGGMLTMVRMVAISLAVIVSVGGVHMAYTYAVSDPMEVLD